MKFNDKVDPNNLQNTTHPELKEGEIFLINIHENDPPMEGIPSWLESTRKGTQAYTTIGKKLPQDQWHPLFGIPITKK